MRIEAIGTGKTVEEALENAYQELGVSREKADFEILERPKKSLFGLRVTPAKVMVFAEIEEKKPEPRKEAPAPRPVVERRPEPERKPAPSVSPAQPAPKPEQREPKPVAPKAPAPRLEKKPEPPVVKDPTEQPEAKPVAEAIVTETIEAVVEKKPRDPEAIRAKVECAQAYLQAIFAQMGLGEVEIKVTEREESVVFTLGGEGLGVLIGRRGETLDALQYLAGLVANRLEGDYFRVTIDSGNYREKREKTLEQLAKKLSSQVVKTGRNLTLEPMNPYERRIIHSTVQTIEGVTSSSIGEEPNRRVVISSTAPRKKYPPKPAGARTGGGRGPRRPQSTSAPRPEGSTQDKPRSNPPRDGQGAVGASPSNHGSRPPYNNGNRGGRPPYNNNRNGSGGAKGITTRTNAFPGGPQQPAKRIDDSAYEIEPPVRTASLKPATPKPAVPKTDAPAEAKPLYSKIELD